MRGWLLDTNVISELRRARAHPGVVAFVSGKPLDHLYVSTVTLAEIRFGIEQITDSARREGLTTWLVNHVRPMFAGRVLEITEDVMVTWRRLVEAGRQTGYTHSQPDLIIAVIALRAGLTIVTRDVGGFERTGVPILNPWTEAP